MFYSRFFKPTNREIFQEALCRAYYTVKQTNCGKITIPGFCSFNESTNENVLLSTLFSQPLNILSVKILKKVFILNVTLNCSQPYEHEILHKTLSVSFHLKVFRKTLATNLYFLYNKNFIIFETFLFIFISDY